MNLNSSKKWLIISSVLTTFTISCNESSEDKLSVTNTENQIENSESNEIQEKKPSVFIGDLEIAGEDFPEYMDWIYARREADKLGNGWRLPTIEELRFMYENRKKIGGFEEMGAFAAYWSSTRYEFGEAQVWTLSFSDGLKYHQVLGVSNRSFRLVRDKK